MNFKVPSLVLEKEDKLRLQKLMTDSHAILVKAASRNQMNICELRDAYRSKTGEPLDITVEEMGTLDDLLDNEQTILAGWIRVGLDLCLAFSIAFGKNLQLDLDDLISEAYMKVYNAIYLYDGSTEFSTYVYWLVKRKMCSIVKTVRRRLARESLVPVEAFAHMHAPDYFHEDGKAEEAKQEMIEAIVMTPLTETQRVILEEYIHCDFNQAEAARHLKKVSRQAINQTIKLVITKMKETLHERSKTAA